mmetsp:Transcript_3228/g.7238  ORF Transcript_3228/g.7238 Transcript_3228/m.7238 type:complete len:216 (+) Transcript_3228:1183-1830(+)
MYAKPLETWVSRSLARYTLCILPKGEKRSLRSSSLVSSEMLVTRRVVWSSSSKRPPMPIPAPPESAPPERMWSGTYLPPAAAELGASAIWESAVPVRRPWPMPSEPRMVPEPGAPPRMLDSLAANSSRFLRLSAPERRRLIISSSSRFWALFSSPGFSMCTSSRLMMVVSSSGPGGASSARPNLTQFWRSWMRLETFFFLVTTFTLRTTFCFSPS